MGFKEPAHEPQRWSHASSGGVRPAAPARGGCRAKSLPRFFAVWCGSWRCTLWPSRQVGRDGARVGALRTVLQPRDDAPLRVPGLGRIVGPTEHAWLGLLDPVLLGQRQCRQIHLLLQARVLLQREDAVHAPAPQALQHAERQKPESARTMIFVFGQALRSGIRKRLIGVLTMLAR